MYDIKQAISKASLPIELPETAFVLHKGEPRLCNFSAMLQALPEEIRCQIDREVTINSMGGSSFAVPLKDGSYLLVKLKGCAISSLELLIHP
ncbi:MAG: hypothetical protein RMM17_09845 [Acidobacteriota bacterium]|nr:hypothetical protein [Blastocatellia bacterium]MDW8412970.1 hypothetical protein [Acidobacteriota bacterium]